MVDHNEGFIADWILFCRRWDVSEQQTEIPEILAGPIVRRARKDQVSLWLVTRERFSFRATLRSQKDAGILFDAELNEAQCQQIQVGTHAWVVLLDISPSEAFPLVERIAYDLQLTRENGEHCSLSQLLPAIAYEGMPSAGFEIHQTLNEVLHGSCRKPHHKSGDGLLRVDQQISAALKGQQDMPDMLIMSGDQVYVDDVAGPMLVAIHQTISLLGLFDEQIEGAVVADSQSLYQHPHSYYQRPLLLPEGPNSDTLYKKMFRGARKPVFTSVHANNHLMTFAEVIAMYLLVWSEALWPLLDFGDDKDVGDPFKPRFGKEKRVLDQFVTGLPQVRRALANIPVYMIFDDHDITDDWNLTRGWEEAIYGDPFAKRIIGNALIGYWLCQGWGNDSKRLQGLHDAANRHFTPEGIVEHDKLVDTLLGFDQWHYHLDTSPKLVVLDTRTQRWRSESSLGKPSGLMDWEALCELQQELLNQPSVIMVSAAPVFGVKLIETIQKIFTLFGGALTVDAENWMAHKGTASVILNIFRHHKTPPHFVILSGDVHYSFVYDVKLRFRRHSPRITQVTSSGIKNEFPEGLLRWFDRLNRILYARRSPLNWFTQRRTMSIRPRKPQGMGHTTLLNHSGIGMLKVRAHGQHIEALQLCANGKDIAFIAKSSDDGTDDHV